MYESRAWHGHVVVRGLRVLVDVDHVLELFLVGDRGDVGWACVFLRQNHLKMFSLHPFVRLTPPRGRR